MSTILRTLLPALVLLVAPLARADEAPEPEKPPSPTSFGAPAEEPIPEVKPGDILETFDVEMRDRTL